MAINLLTFLVSFLFISSGLTPSHSVRITIINYCKETIWPGITATNSTSDGFQLKTTESYVFSAPAKWSGRVWARTGCNFDTTNNNATCATGGCGPAIKCNGPGQPPASVAEFTLNGGYPSWDFYDVSLVDGFNVPVMVQPISGRGGKCGHAGCYDDQRPNCPAELALRSDVGGKTVTACQSACRVFDTDEYCCRGTFSTPMACMPTNYSRVFKQGCPAAYSFAYDDPTSIMTCSAGDYMVAFCSARNETRCGYHDNRLVCSGALAGVSTTAVRLLALAAAAFGFSIMLKLILVPVLFFFCIEILF